MTQEHVGALDLQGELYRWWSGPQGKVWIRGVVDVQRNDPRMAHAGLSPERMGQTAKLEAAKLAKAPTYWVHPDMVHLTERAAQKMEVETLEIDDLPSPSGFVLLGETIPIPMWASAEDAVELGIPIGQGPFVGFSWGPYGGGIHLVTYTTPEWLRPGRTAGMARAMLYNQHDWIFGTTSIKDEYRAIHQFCKAFWALCSQRIGRAEPEPIDRAARRRAGRAGLEELVGVQVVRLRRQVHQPADGERPVDWSCRWIVDGHWRNQWYPSAGLHRQKWIDEYVKGPEDAPLRMKDRVYRVDR